MFNRSAGLSGRVGWLVMFGCSVTAIISALGASASRWSNTDMVGLMWLLPVAVSAFCGLSMMRACRDTSMIESELLRAGKDGGWREARPLVSASPIAAGWNSLLEQAVGRAETPDQRAGDSNSNDSQSCFARAIRSLPLGMAITNAEGRIRTGNVPLAALVNVAEAKDLEGLSIAEALKLSDASNGEEAGQTLSTESRTVSFQLHQGESTADGVLRVTRNRLAGRDGDVDGYVFIVQDVTQQVLAAESRDQFLATASHELRTPLANLKAYAEALVIEDGIDVEQQKQFCNIINDESTRLARLVDELLAVGQMEAGSIVLNRSDVDFSRVIHESIENIQPNADKKNQRLEVNISPKLPMVRGDKDKLQAALVNLLGNAVKYTGDEGEIQIRVVSEDGVLRIDVQDSGVGISEEDSERVFEKFFRASDERVTNESGNGLGLAFTREIVRRHGGDVTVESVLDEGSVFSMTLPVPQENS